MRGIKYKKIYFKRYKGQDRIWRNPRRVQENNICQFKRNFWIKVWYKDAVAFF